MSTDWVQKILAHPDLRKMGHGQRFANANLGLGWLYYGLVRIERPKRVVCIGSWRGFVPIVLASALRDNGKGGRLTFIDPSLADDFWMNPQRTRDWFASFGLDNVEHHLSTTQDFVGSDAFHAIDPVGLLFVDGFHSEEQARFDHEAFIDKLTDDAIVLFHDSIRPSHTGIYGADAAYVHTAYRYLDELARRHDLQLMDFPLGSGVTAVRRSPRHPGQTTELSESTPSSLRNAK
jgi:predicted O-methyltransferase YrrM